MASRPYLNKSLEDLERLFRQEADNPLLLEELLAELRYRATSGATRFQNRVKTRLIEIRNSRPRQTERAIAESRDNGSDEVAATTASTLEQIRKRLLDLSRRNTLLNYRHPANRSIRVVDEMPDQLFTELMTEKSFVFDPLPRVPRLGEQVTPSIREYLERQPDARRPSAKEWAELHGIDPSYELPAPGSSAGRHQDLSIQTLLFPRDLETRLRTMGQLARTAIEESGANILYLAFGFLEWRESDDSDQASLAPLVLTPVSLKKEKGLDARTRRERFSLTYSGEDLQSNLSLRERLSKDFSLSLPELEDEDTPENYIERCRPLLRSQPTWRISRYVTLGFFQFGKLLMYLDLDPARWPEKAAIVKNSLIRQILGGEPFEDRRIVDVAHIDHIPLDAPEVQLIEQADSSQHAAIIEATQGRSLVIEGPPGTGKSQTITNIIGVALAQGKSVLFVSEKLAALEVVRSRMESAGLGSFCLELHSHKTQKRKFIEDIARRLDNQVRALSRSKVEQERKHYESIRNEIGAYIRLVNETDTAYEGSFHELFCEAAWLRQRLLTANVTVDPQRLVNLPDATALAIASACGSEIRRARVQILDQHDSLDQHPWYGLILRSGTSTPDELRRVLEAWSNAAKELCQAAQSLEIVEGIPRFDSYGDLLSTARLASQLPSEALGQFNVARALSTTAEDTPLEKLLAWEEQLTRAFEGARGIWDLSQASPSDLWTRLAPTFEKLRLNSVDLCRHSVQELTAIRDCLDRVNAQASQVSEGAINVAAVVGQGIPADASGLAFTKEILHIALQRPVEALSRRTAILETVDDISLLESLATQRAEILRDRAKLSIQFDLSTRTDINQLQAVRSILEGATFFSIFDSEWRSANSIYQSLRHKKSFLRSAKAKIADLESLEALATAEQFFAHNPKYTAALGPDFLGLDTPAEEYLAVCQWFHGIKTTFGTSPDIRGRVGRLLMRLTEDDLNKLDALCRSSLPASIDYASEGLQQLGQHDAALTSQLFSGGWAAFPDSCASTAELVRSATETLYSATRDTERRATISEGAAILKRVADMLESPGRATLHRRFLRKELTGVWNSGQIAAGHALVRVQRCLTHIPSNSAIRHGAKLVGESPQAKRVFGRIWLAFEKSESGYNDATKLFILDEEGLFDAPILESHWTHIAERLEGCLTTTSEAELWIGLARAVDTLTDLDDGFEQVRVIAFHANVPEEIVAIAPRALMLSRLAIESITNQPLLKNFSTKRHERLLEKFRDADNQLKRLSRTQIAAIAYSNEPPAGTTGRKVADLTEMQLIRHELGKQKRHLPIRKVMRRAGRAMQSLKPCFMMGPLSVAQYLNPGAIAFDIAVMDEASQVRPEDALGTIARCKQLIVVGDPKQLPPTNFFDRLSTDDPELDEDDDLTFGGQESILDIATPLFSPTRILAWHYRSRHEGLIAFSNSSFYNKRLLLFPTAHSSAEHLGLHYKRVDGTFANHVNVEEAQALIRDVIREVRSGRKRSIGIAAVNFHQAQAIRDEWDRVTRELPDLQELLYEDDGSLEPLFIKNLENVQGDERDVIFISLTYGKDRNGNFYQRFGPINRDDGWRRLNVLFTRAKEKMFVFSSMDSAFITPTPASKRGVVALRDFLSYCETGVVPEAAIRTGTGPDSPFEQDVANVIQEFGLEAEFQVGVAGFFIDIGVIDPGAPGEYLFGIECDGATYHTAQSVRDRDKIRQEVLENLGWKIYRIWSTDWFKEGPKERERLRRALEHARLEAEERRAAAQLVVDEPSVSDDGTASHVAEVIPQEIGSLECDSSSELRQKLHDLRKVIEDEFPDTRPENALLHEDVVQALLRTQPTTLMGFHQSIPLDRRLQIDMEQSRTYLSTVLALIEGFS